MKTKIRRLKADSASAAVEAARGAQAPLPPAPGGFSTGARGHWDSIVAQLCRAERDRATLTTVAEMAKARALADKLAGATAGSQVKRLAEAEKTILRCVSALGLVPGSRRFRTWGAARRLEADERARIAAQAPPSAASAEPESDEALLDLFFASLLAGGPPEPPMTPRLRRLLDAWHRHTPAERRAWIAAADARRGRVSDPRFRDA